MKTRLRSTIELVVTIGLILLALIAFGYFYMQTNKSQRKEIGERKSRIASLKEDHGKAIEELKTREDQVATLEKKILERKKEIEEKFENLLDFAENYPTFIEQIQKKAREHSISIISSNYESPTPVNAAISKYLEFKFNLDVKGSYENMKHFLWGTENTLGRFVKISKMVVRPPVSDTDGNMGLSITLSTFFQANK
ncbi:type 4a pilus biogenesis protein PilO [bacterium]|nr:type 4a pilus biogenesis protein PilO [bacterium]